MWLWISIICHNKKWGVNMDLMELNNDIRYNNLKNLYIFTGEEIELQNIYLHQMGEYQRVDSVGNVFTSLTSKMLKPKNIIYVVRDDHQFMRNDKAFKSLADKIKNGTLVLQITNLDKRSAFYKHFKQDIIEFNHLTTNQLATRVEPLIRGDKGVITYFIERCNNDYNTILNEIDKIKRLGYNELTKEIVDEMIYKKAEYTPFDLVDNLMMKNSQECFKMLEVILKDNAGMATLYAMANQFHNCVLVEGYRGQANISKITGVNGWVCNNILKYNRIRPSDLLYALRLVQRYDKGVKTGLYDINTALTSLVCEILTL